jgi:hypothetical protein
MARLIRPYIPLAVRVQVAERQVDAAIAALGQFDPETDKHSRNLAVFRDFVDRQSWHAGRSAAHKLSLLLQLLFGDDAKPELHHRPALVNRPRNRRETDYVPPANDPDYLVYLLEDVHDIETRVRGLGAQRSDLSQARYLKKVAKNRTAPKRKSRFSSPLSRAGKSTWPKRKFETRRKP